MSSNQEKRQPPPNYFSRSQQLRLLMLVMSLGLVIVMMIEAAKPENWVWLTGETAEEKKPVVSDDYDTSYQPALPPESTLDEVRIPLETDPTAIQGKRYFPGVKPGLLEEVEDNRPHRPQEANAWYNLWQVLAITDSKLIDGASSGIVSFVQLFEQPDAYRGELVSLVGIVHRAEWFDAPENTAKVPGFYRLSVRLKDGPSRPVFLYCLSVPDNFPEGDKLHEEFQATAFFYKNWNYQASDISYIAPVLMSRDITWIPAASNAKPIPSWKVIFGTTLAVGLVATLFAVYVYRRSSTMFGEPGSHGRAATESEIARLAELPAAPPVSEQLRHLAEKE